MEGMIGEPIQAAFDLKIMVDVLNSFNVKVNVKDLKQPTVRFVSSFSILLFVLIASISNVCPSFQNKYICRQKQSCKSTKASLSRVSLFARSHMTWILRMRSFTLARTSSRLNPIRFTSSSFTCSCNIAFRFLIKCIIT